jgi:hypothetical protein
MEDFSHSFSWDEEANVSFHVTWKGIDYLKWLNEIFSMYFLVTWKGIDCLKWLNGRFSMYFPMTWKNKCIFNKCIFSCHMKRHWLVEMAKWETPRAFLHDMEANAFPHVTWRCIDWLRWSMGDSSCISPWHKCISSCDMKKQMWIQVTILWSIDWWKNNFLIFD